MKLKKCYRKGYQIFGAHMEEAPKDKVPNLEDYEVMKDFDSSPRPPKPGIHYRNNVLFELFSICWTMSLELKTSLSVSDGRNYACPGIDLLGYGIQISLRNIIHINSTIK
jgi:hypothetical protein